MSSSEPRLTKSTRSQPELTGAEVNLLKSTVPFTTHILLVGAMLLFFLGATLITLQASWQWWLIPAAIALPVLAVLTERVRRVRKAKEARRAMEAQLRSAGRRTAAGPGQTGSAR